VANLRTRRPRLDPDAFIAAAEGGPALQPTSIAVNRSEPKPSVRRSNRGRGKDDTQGRVRSWEGPNVRDDVTKAFNLRLPEPLKLKLDFIREHTRISIHEFIMTVIVPAVDLEIERLERRQK
jgi:hypothetical protein